MTERLETDGENNPFDANSMDDTFAQIGALMSGSVQATGQQMSMAELCGLGSAAIPPPGPSSSGGGSSQQPSASVASNPFSFGFSQVMLGGPAQGGTESPQPSAKTGKKRKRDVPPGAPDLRGPAPGTPGPATVLATPGGGRQVGKPRRDLLKTSRFVSGLCFLRLCYTSSQGQAARWMHEAQWFDGSPRLRVGQ